MILKSVVNSIRHRKFIVLLPRSKIFEALKSEIEEIRDWASSNPLVRIVYIYGSHVLGETNPESDLDVAIEIDTMAGDTDPLTTWIGEGEKWKDELQTKLMSKLHLEWYDLN